ncbi:MAG: hypothetical protein ACXWEK_07550 [Solirubrobacterales bacterium]
MSFSEYLLGAAELALIAATLCLGAYFVRAAIVPAWSGAPARLAEAVLAITGLVVVSELLGVVGLFEPGFLVGGCVLAGLGAAGVARRRAGDAETPAPPRPDVNPWMTAVGVAIAALLVVHWAMPTQSALDVGMYSQDTVWYHMSFAGHFAQDARVGPILITDPLKVVSWFYPQNSELLHGVGIASFGHDNLSPLINLGWMALCLLAAWCVGRPYGVAPLTLAGAALVLDTPMMVEQAGNAPSDTIALFFLLATIALLVNADAAARRDANEGPASPPTGDINGVSSSGGGLVGPLFLAALAAGLAIGTKITLLAAIGVLTLALLIYAGRGNRLRFVGVWGAGLVLPSAFWYLRNLKEAHNPLPWVQAGPLPGPDQLDLYPRKPHTVAHYATDTGIWSDWFFPALHDRLGPLWVLLLVGALAGLVVLLIRGRTPMLRVLALVGLVAAAAYAFTPLSAAGAEGSPSGFAPNLRYFSPGFAVGLVLLPLAIPLLNNVRRRQVALGVLVAALLAGTIVQITFKPPQFSQAEIEQIATEGQGGFRSFQQDSYDFGQLPGALLLAGVLVGVPFALSRLPKGRGARIAVAGGSAALILGLVAIGWPASRDYVRDRYDTRLANPFEREAGFRASTDWKQIQQWGRNLTDTRIAVVGRAAAFGQFVFYGPAASTHGPYSTRRLPNRGSRPVESCLAWRQALNEGDYDYVVITPQLGAGAFSTPPEIGWTQKDKAVQAVLQTAPAAVFRLSGELDPALCTPAAANAGAKT